MSTRPPRPLTMDEAARLTRREILDRGEAEQARLLARRSKTPVQHAQLVLGFDEQRGSVTVTCACGGWTPKDGTS